MTVIGDFVCVWLTPFSLSSTGSSPTGRWGQDAIHIWKRSCKQWSDSSALCYTNYYRVYFKVSWVRLAFSCVRLVGTVGHGPSNLIKSYNCLYTFIQGWDNNLLRALIAPDLAIVCGTLSAISNRSTLLSSSERANHRPQLNLEWRESCGHKQPWIINSLIEHSFSKLNTLTWRTFRSMLFIKFRQQPYVYVYKGDWRSDYM